MSDRTSTTTYRVTDDYGCCCGNRECAYHDCLTIMRDRGSERPAELVGCVTNLGDAAILAVALANPIEEKGRVVAFASTARDADRIQHAMRILGVVEAGCVPQLKRDGSPYWRGR